MVDNEFRVQVRVGTVALANIVIGLKRKGEITAFRSANALIQAALQIAENELVMQGPEEEEIRSIDEAIEILEETKLFDFSSSSANQRNMFKGRRRESVREAKEDIGRYNNRGRDTRHTMTQEEIDNIDPTTYNPGPMRVDPALTAHLSQEMLRMRNEKRMEDRPKVIPGTADEWNRLAAERGNPTLHPDRTKTTPDVDETLSREEKIQRLKDREKENI